MPEMLTGAVAPNLGDVVVRGDAVVFRSSASASSSSGDAYTIGLITEFAQPARVAAEVASYLPNAPKSALLVKVRWCLKLDEDERTFDAHEYPLASRCTEVVLLRQESWMTIEDIIDVALIWHVGDVEAATHPAEGMTNVYVIAHEETRKRKKTGPSLRGFSLQPLKASEWTALAEDKATGLGRF